MISCKAHTIGRCKMIFIYEEKTTKTLLFRIVGKYVVAGCARYTIVYSTAVHPPLISLPPLSFSLSLALSLALSLYLCLFSTLCIDFRATNILVLVFTSLRSHFYASTLNLIQELIYLCTLYTFHRKFVH